MVGRLKKVFNKSTFNKVGIFSISLFVTSAATYIFAPIVGSHANESIEAQVTVTIGESLSFSLSANNLSLNASVGDFVSGDITANVTTNSEYGYTLTLEDSDDESSLVHENVAISDKFTSEFDGTKTQSEMGDNTWGFSLDGTDYSHIPIFGNPVTLKTTNTAVSGSGDLVPVTFGAKVGTSSASGAYADTVKFSLYVNGASEESSVDIHSITNMQDMTAAICSAATTPNVNATQFDWDGSHHDDKTYIPRVKLTDTRDNKTYLVSKLADGNCWMSQSLALDLTANTAIVASNNDGTTKTVTPNSTTQTTTGTIWAQSDDNWRSYKPQAAESYYQAGTTKASSPSDTGDAYDWEKAGNYYNWYAATAGTGTSALVSAEAGSSICPKGWRLPSNTGDKSFLNLITTTYGLASSSEGSLALRANPLNFNLSGFFDNFNMAGRQSAATMFRQGTGGFYWSSSAYSDVSRAYNLAFSTLDITPQNNYYGGRGFSVRCVAI